MLARVLERQEIVRSAARRLTGADGAASVLLVAAFGSLDHELLVAPTG